VEECVSGMRLGNAVNSARYELHAIS
jgi:hypothetical protein